MSAFRLERQGALARLRSEHFDLLVIGGGITGAGVARIASRAGLRVALVEANDYAAGTSSRSSKLIHGGLRYLAMGDVALVRETALERKAVHQMAPHLAEPSWMLLPVKNRASLLKFQVGITAYEKLGAVVDVDLHQSWNREALGEREPALRADRYPWACVYREYLTDDARLVLAALRDAAGHGAAVANHLGVTSLIRDGDRISGALARCALSGDEIKVQARIVVNAAGPWVEQVAASEHGSGPSRLHLSKGVHVVVPRSKLPVQQMVVVGTRDKRSMFVIPRGDVVYIGTTDTSYQGGPDLWPAVEREDVDYLLAPLGQYFDVPELTADDVVGAWAGLRPLIAQPGKEAKEMSRKDEVWVSDSGLVTIAGGKLTGFRKMAEQVLSAVLDRAGLKALPEDDLAALPGGDFDGDLQALANNLAGSNNISKPHALRLVRLYGSEAADVVARGVAPVVPGGRMTQGELSWALEMEGALTLEDVIYRRSRTGLYAWQEASELLVPVAQFMAKALGWDAERLAREQQQVQDRLGADLNF